MIDNPVPTQRALLVWQRPLEVDGRRDRCAVAELVQNKDGFSFSYFSEDELADAFNAGFSNYPGLPRNAVDLDSFASETLMRRLPPRDRPDFGDMLERYGLPRDRNYSDLSLLAYTGARLTSDSFSICETFVGFDTPFTYIFDVAGYRHNRDEDHPLEIGETLNFVMEPDNEFDPNAIAIARENGSVVGYVNRTQAHAVSQWLEEGSISSTVFRINGRSEYPRLFVQAKIENNSQSLAA